MKLFFRTKWKRQTQQQQHQQQSEQSDQSMTSSFPGQVNSVMPPISDSRPSAVYCQPLLCTADLNRNAESYFPYIRSLPAVFSTSCHFS